MDERYLNNLVVHLNTRNGFTVEGLRYGYTSGPFELHKSSSGYTLNQSMKNHGLKVIIPPVKSIKQMAFILEAMINYTNAQDAIVP